MFEECVEKAARHHFRLKCYFMVKPVPGMTDAEAVADIHHAIDYLDSVGARFGATINMHVNPTYVPAGTPLEAALQRGEYTPPTLASVLAAIRHAEGKRLTVTVGLNDEGLAVPGGSFLRPGDEALHAALEQFNHDQNYGALPVA